MAITDSIVNYRRFLKRRNYSAHTVKNYMGSLRQFVLWMGVPIEQVTPRIVSQYIDFLMNRRLKAKTINCHLQRIREFYHFLLQEEELKIANPVRRGYSLRMPKALPKHLLQEQLDAVLGALKSCRDRAMFMLMLRCGLRVSEVSNDPR